MIIKLELLYMLGGEDTIHSAMNPLGTRLMNVVPPIIQPVFQAHLSSR